MYPDPGFDLVLTRRTRLGNAFDHGEHHGDDAQECHRGSRKLTHVFHEQPHNIAERVVLGHQIDGDAQPDQTGEYQQCYFYGDPV